MNKQRRNEIDQIINCFLSYKIQLESAIADGVKVEDEFSIESAEIENMRDEEQSCFDNLPESFQDGEKGETMQVAIDAMENAIGLVDEITDLLDQSRELGTADEDAFELYQKIIDLIDDVSDFLQEATQ